MNDLWVLTSSSPSLPCLSLLFISFMPCSVCITSALRGFLTSCASAETTRLHLRNVRYLTIENSRHLCHTNSFTLGNQPARTNRISTLQPSLAQGFLDPLSRTENPGRMEEPPHRGRNNSMIGLEDPARVHNNSGAPAQTATIPVALCSRRDSPKTECFLKPKPSPKDEASFNESWSKEEFKGRRQRTNVISGWRKDSTRETKSGCFKLPGSSRKARLPDYSSGAVEWNKGTLRSSRSTTAPAEIQIGTQNTKDQREPWQTQKSALSEKFGPTGWLPRKRLSPDTLDGIRTLHAQYPDKFTTPRLADQFQISPEAIRRILKSKWRPKDEEEERRRRRWEKRGENIWTRMVEMGIKPPKKWRDQGVGRSRERKPARSEQLESLIKSKSKSKSKSKVASSLLVPPTTDLHTISANRHETSSLVSLADRIL